MDDRLLLLCRELSQSDLSTLRLRYTEYWLYASFDALRARNHSDLARKIDWIWFWSDFASELSKDTLFGSSKEEKKGCEIVSFCLQIWQKYVKKWKILYCSINEEPRTRFKLLRGFPCPRISVRGRGFASPNDVTSERSQNQPTTLSFPVRFQHFFQNMEIFRTSLALSFWKVSTYFWKKRFCDKKGKTSWTIRCNFHHFLLFFFCHYWTVRKALWFLQMIKVLESKHIKMVTKRWPKSLRLLC